MTCRLVHPALLTLTACLLAAFQLPAQQPAGDDLYAAQEKLMKTAVAKVAPSVVQIQTAGGIDVITAGGGGAGGGRNPMGGGTMIRKGVGPTTGLVVSADGYIVSSAFNFANKPGEIFVTLPGNKQRFVAKVVANDTTRMITLLKIEATNLPVPQATPKKSMKVGQWSLALGRTWGTLDGSPSTSVGIISALDRIWGKAIQCDAKISPVNYGGPLIDIEGRVQGVLVPASPRGQDETAGVEWYDSGIGFAIPLEDIFAVLPRLKKGETLNRGFLGITPQAADIYSAAPTIATVAPESAAAKAGLKAGDVIVEIDGVKVVRQAQVMHLLGPKYEGDIISIKVRRGTGVIEFPKLPLTGQMVAFVHPFLGILPLRDDPELGVEIRYVFPKGPAATAGLKIGDRIMALGIGKQPRKPFAGRDGLAAILNTLAPETEISLDVRRKGAKANETVTLKLAAMTDEVPDKLPEPSSLKKALEPKKTIGIKPPAQPAPKKEDPKKVETGMIKRNNAARDHEYWIWVPENYDPNIAHALVVWLHPIGKGKDKDAEAFRKIWDDFAFDHHVILVGPRAVNESGWLVSEADVVREVVRDVSAQYTIDRQRIVAHGMGVGGQLAFYLGNNARDVFRGVAATGAVLANKMGPNVGNQRLAFFITTGNKDPRAKAIGDSRAKLLEQKFPVTFRELQERGHEYLENSPRTLDELVRWIDALDRL